MPEVKRAGRSRRRSGQGAGRGGLDRGAAGYSLVFLVMAITTMNILIAMALPVWSHLIQRQKEEELIFRGLQYAEAIRRYQTTHGGNLPVRIEALLEEEPRHLRQYWTNPMREDGKWTLILQTGVNPGTPPGGDQGGNRNRGGTQPAPNPGQVGQPGQPGQPPQIPTVEFDPAAPEEQQTVGPIIGVYSSEGGEAIKVFNNSSAINEWHFRADMFGAPVIQGDGVLECPPINARWIGRPFPPGINPPCMTATGGQGTQLGGSAGDGNPGGGGAGGGNPGAGGGGAGGGAGNPGSGGGRPRGIS